MPQSSALQPPCVVRPHSIQCVSPDIQVVCSEIFCFHRVVLPVIKQMFCVNVVHILLSWFHKLTDISLVMRLYVYLRVYIYTHIYIYIYAVSLC